MDKNKKNTVGSFIAISVLSAGLTACGGSDSGSSTSVPSGSEHLAITGTNSDQVSVMAIGAVLGSSDLNDSAEFKVVGAQNSTKLIDAAKTPVNILLNQKRSKALGKSVSENCSGGGSITASSTDITGNSGTVTFNNCIEDGTTMNGKVSFSESGDTSTLKYTNFSLKDDEASVVFNSATFVSSDSYSLLDLTGYAEVGSDRADYKNYRVEAEQTGSFTSTITIDGYIKTTCTVKWLNIVTNKDIVVNDFENCPTDGQLTVKGNNSSLSVVYNSDQSIDISVNSGASTHYDNCTDVSSANVCQ